MTEPLDWSGDAPRSLRFDDIYFSPADGLAEARAVFLTGCGLPEAWAGRERFTVGELGFGSGLNILALIALWRAARPRPDAVLQIFSVDGFPMSGADAARALSHWPDLSDLAQPLLTHWPKGRRGFHRIEWPALGVILDLAVAEVEEALAAWSGGADAWFLDGFAPSKNPQMWSPEVMRLVAARSRPDARAATFSVAGAVRRNLAEAGFQITRAPGFGRKKERLEARLGPSAEALPPASRSDRPRVAVIGAGIAGASLARAFQRQGRPAAVFDRAGVGAGASGNPAALVTPRLDAGLGPNARLYAQAFARATQLYRDEAPGAILAQGAAQLAVHPRDPARFDKIAGWEGFDPLALERLDPNAAAASLEEAQAADALHLRDALVIDPAVVLKAWLPKIRSGRPIARLEAEAGVWRLIDTDGQTVMEADIVCLAAGPASAQMTQGAPLRAVRGQVSFSQAIPFTGTSAAFSGYAIPMREGVLFGATHDRDDWSEDPRADDDARNLALLRQGRPALAARLEGAPLRARASLRAMAPDHMPLAGPVAGAGAVVYRPGLFVLSGFGGRGFTLAPLLAEAVAALALGAPSPLPRALAAQVDPARFGEPRSSVRVSS